MQHIMIEDKAAAASWLDAHDRGGVTAVAAIAEEARGAAAEPPPAESPAELRYNISVNTDRSSGVRTNVPSKWGLNMPPGP